jgi:hypothetical protein
MAMAASQMRKKSAKSRRVFWGNMKVFQVGGSMRTFFEPLTILSQLGGKRFGVSFAALRSACLGFVG